MKLKTLFYLGISFVMAVCYMSCSSDNEDMIDRGDIVSPEDNYIMPIVDWTATTNDIENAQNEDYVLTSSNNNLYIYEYSSDEDITISYLFGNNNMLVSSSVVLKNNAENTQRLYELLRNFNLVGTKNSSKIYSNLANGIAAMLIEGHGGDGKEYISLCFSSYTLSDNDEQEEENLDYVDLGLSVKWAKANVGASSPEKSGGFYSWSETSTKSKYWRENYSFCNNNSNVYIFEYTNPLANIAGTKYDIATKVMGEGWRMPTRDEALELIYSCTWKQEIVNGIKGAKITGPNGKSIFIPNTGYKKQDKDASGATNLWTSESIGKSDETAYTICTSPSMNTEPKLDIIWKAWGLPVRAVKSE